MSEETWAPPPRVANSHLSWWRLLILAHGDYGRAVWAMDFCPRGWRPMRVKGLSVVVPKREIPVVNNLRYIGTKFTAAPRHERTAMTTASYRRPVVIDGAAGTWLYKGELVWLHPWQTDATAIRACDWRPHKGWEAYCKAKARARGMMEAFTDRPEDWSWKWAKGRPSCAHCMTLEDAAQEWAAEHPKEPAPPPTIAQRLDRTERALRKTLQAPPRVGGRRAR